MFLFSLAPTERSVEDGGCFARLARGVNLGCVLIFADRGHFGDQELHAMLVTRREKEKLSCDMTMPKTFITEQGRTIAFHKSEGKGPGVVFLGGFASDMDGTKAVFLEQWAQKNSRAFLRFDYSGHGQSSGEFRDGCIGEWAADAMAVIAAQTDGPQILVGSSMGGWISLLVARAMPERVGALVGVAAAPDFTEDSMWAGMSNVLRAKLQREGVIYEPSDYGDPYTITLKLIEDGRNQLVLRDELPLPFPVRLLHGTADADVDMQVPLRLMDHAACDDLQLNFVKGADHRFSDPRCLGLIQEAVAEVSGLIR